MARQGAGVEKQWAVPGSSYGSPVRGPHGEIYVSHNQQPGDVACLDPSDGHVVWSVSTGGGQASAPVLFDERTLLVSGQDGQVHALDPSTGGELWSLPVASGSGKLFKGGDGLLYSWHHGKLDGIDVAGRKCVRSTSVRQEFEDAPVVAPDGTIYGGGHDGDLYALEQGSGRVKWHTPSGGMLRNSPAIGPDGTVYAGCIGKALVAFEPSQGREKWRFPTPHWIIPTPVVTPDGTVLAGCSNHALYAIDPGTGKERWHFDMNGEVRVSPSPGRDGIVYAVSDRNTLYGLDAGTGRELWKAPAPSYVHCPLAPDGLGGFVFGSNDNTLVAMRDPETRRRVTLEDVLKNPQETAPPPTIERHDGWLVVGGVRVPVRTD